MTTILVVEDAPIVRDLITRYLQREGYRILVAGDGEEALRHAPEADLLVLDLMLPKVDGLEVCRRVRAVSNQPIIMLTARGRVRDKLAGLGLGADDYIVKPFSAPELIARIRVILRRAAGHPEDDDIIRVGGLRINTRTRLVERDDIVLDLSEREFDLLLVLARNAGQPFSRAQLLKEVWGDVVTGQEHVVTVYIGRLRRKIEPYPGRPRYLKTTRGEGYTLKA